MANQITHIVLAEKIFSQLPQKLNRGHFLVGTIFPDIRYLKVIEREKTHFKNLSFNDVLGEQNSFIAGMKYHSLVDEVREKYMIENNIYSILPPSQSVIAALKTYEDEILYSKVSTWKQTISYLDEILIEEKELIENTDTIKTWHSLLQEYFKESPTDHSRKNLILGVGFSDEVAVEINKLIEHMRQVSEVRDSIINLYDNWNSLIKFDNTK